MPGHLIRPGNGDEMLVKDSPSSLAVRSQILQKILRHAVYRDLMNTTRFSVWLLYVTKLFFVFFVKF